MGLSMSLVPRLYMECKVCYQSMEDHASDCPQGRLNQVIQNERSGKCPLCLGKTQINKGDFWECRKCKTQFCSGAIVPGMAPRTKRNFHEMESGEDFIRVVELPDKGHGKFKIDEMIAFLREEIKRVKKQRSRRHSVNQEDRNQEEGK